MPTANSRGGGRCLERTVPPHAASVKCGRRTMPSIVTCARWVAPSAGRRLQPRQGSPRTPVEATGRRRSILRPTLFAAIMLQGRIEPRERTTRREQRVQRSRATDVTLQASATSPNHVDSDVSAPKAKRAADEKYIEGTVLRRGCGTVTLQMPASAAHQQRQRFRQRLMRPRDPQFETCAAKCPQTFLIAQPHRPPTTYRTDRAGLHWADGISGFPDVVATKIFSPKRSAVTLPSGSSLNIHVVKRRHIA